MINETVATVCAIVLLGLIVYTLGMKIWARRKGKSMACAACGRTIIDRPVKMVEAGREIAFCCERCAAAYAGVSKTKITMGEMIPSSTITAEIRAKIDGLKRSLNAIIVVHNYQRPEVQDIADYVGDSLELARICTRVDADVVVFAGVHFMAESAYILNPQRTVLLTEREAGCPMADMITAEDLIEWKQRYPDAAVVTYVNSSAAVKALSDACCTSANGVAVVESMPQEEILFVPDQNLGHYISTKTSKRMILYPGFCPPHNRVLPKHVELARRQYPDAVVLVHPECTPEVIAKADAALSTSQMVRYATESDAGTFIIGTEEGLLHRLRRDNPQKTFHLLMQGLVCPNMKKTTLESVVKTMEQRRNPVTVPEEVRLKAKLALERMLAVA